MENHPSVRAVVVPYDSGHRGLRMGARPDHLIDNGLPEVLRYPDRSSLSWMHVLSEAAPPGEVAVAFELDRLVSERVRGAVSEGEFPLVLSGNCNASVGTLAGAGPEGLGIVWFDGHANFNTPERTTSGFLDGMGLAIAVGHCWKAMAEGVPGFRPVAAENVVLVGARDVGRSEEERLDASGVTFVGAERLGREGLGALGAALDDLGTRVGRVYLHLDLDVLDPGKVGPANGLAPAGAWTPKSYGRPSSWSASASGWPRPASPPTTQHSTRKDGCSTRRSRARGSSRPPRRAGPGRDRLHGLLKGKTRAGAGLQSLEVREERLLDGRGTPARSGGVLFQPQRLEPAALTERVLQPEEPELRPASRVPGGEQAGVGHLLKLRRAGGERDGVAREGLADVLDGHLPVA